MITLVTHARSGRDSVSYCRGTIRLKLKGCPVKLSDGAWASKENTHEAKN